MANFINILLLANGVFCLAPAWSVNEGDLVSVTDCMGEDKVLGVLSVVTDSGDCEIVKMLEKYTGYPLPRITGKYSRKEAVWE